MHTSDKVGSMDALDDGEELRFDVPCGSPLSGSAYTQQLSGGCDRW